MNQAVLRFKDYCKGNSLFLLPSFANPNYPYAKSFALVVVRDKKKYCVWVIRLNPYGGYDAERLEIDCPSKDYAICLCLHGANTPEQGDMINNAAHS